MMTGLMNSNLTYILLLAAVVLTICWLVFQKLQHRYGEYRRELAIRKMQEKRQQREASTGGPSFRAVSIVPARPCCKLARRYASTRYLTAEAPHLPLAGCRMPNCHCRYEHHADRRVEDRRNPFGIDHVPIGIDDNRRRADRRRSRTPALQFS